MFSQSIPKGRTRTSRERFDTIENGYTQKILTRAIGAVKAAMEMQKRFEKLKRKYLEKWQRDEPQTIEKNRREELPDVYQVFEIIYH